MNVRRIAEHSTIPIAFAAGAFAARLRLQTLPPRYAPDMAQPYPIVTAWHADGAAAFAVLAATIAVATVGLVVAARTDLREPSRHDLATVMITAAAALAAAAAWPFGFSSDVYAYTAYGSMVRDGLDPYALLSPAVHGPFYEAARFQWSGTYPVCVYGPFSVAVGTATVALLGGHGVATTIAGLRFATGLAFLASIALLNRSMRGVEPRMRSLALYAYGLNPVALWSVAEGHNDAWLLLAVTGATAVARERPRLGGAVLGLAVLFKAPAVAYVVAAFADRRSRSSIHRPAIWSAAGGLVAGLAVWLPLMRPAFAALGSHGRYAPAVSAQGLLGPIAAGVLAVAAAGYGARLLACGRRSGYAWLGIAASLALPNGYPWYAVWLVPFAVAGGPGRASIALWAATIASVVRYLPDAVGDPGPTATRIAALVATVPLLYALTDVRVDALRKKVSLQP